MNVLTVIFNSKASVNVTRGTTWMGTVSDFSTTLSIPQQLYRLLV